MRSTPSATAEEKEAEEEEVDEVEQEEKATLTCRAPSSATILQTDQTGSTSATFPWTSAPSAQRRGTWLTTAGKLAVTTATISR